MITIEEIAEFAPYYEEIKCARDPGSPSFKQAKFLFEKGCKAVYERESQGTRDQLQYGFYVAQCILPELNRYLSQRASKYPTIRPERKT